MNEKVLLAAITVSILGLAVVPALADTQTTIRTTTITEPSSETTTTSTTQFTLSGSGEYLVVDPLTGMIKGPYDPIRGFVSGTLSPGWVVLDRSNRRVLASFDSSGHLVALSRVAAFDPYVATIDARRADLERYINESLSLGKITADQAMHLRSDLATISAQEEGYRVGGRAITYDEALSIAARLNDLHSTLTGYVPTIALRRLVGTTYITDDGTVMTPVTTTYVPARAITTPARVISSAAVVVTNDDITGRLALMTQRLDDEYKAGRLTNRDVATLKERLNEVSTRQAKYTRNGLLSDSKRRYLTEKLDDIQSSLDRDIASTQRARARIGIRVN